MCVLSRAMSCPRCSPSRLSGLAETWWNSSTAIRRSSKASTPNCIDRKAEGRVGADQHLVVAFEEPPHRLDLAAVVAARRVAQVPLRFDVPVGPEAELASAAHRRSSRRWTFSGTTMIACLSPWLCQLVERDEHQRPALARGRRRLDEQVLLAALLIGALLHRPHAQRIGLGGCAVVGVRDGDGRNGLICRSCACSRFVPFFAWLVVAARRSSCVYSSNSFSSRSVSFLKRRPM